MISVVSSQPLLDDISSDDDDSADVVLDTDNDGVIDTLDDCPLLPETKNGYLDHDGCPDERPLIVPEQAQVNTAADRIDAANLEMIEALMETDPELAAKVLLEIEAIKKGE